MKVFVIAIFYMSLCPMAMAAAFPQARDICKYHADETFRLTQKCEWDPLGIIQTYNPVTKIYTCKGRVVCDNVDSYLINFPYEIKLTDCETGFAPCITPSPKLTPQCRTSMRQREVQRCNSL